jgi:hypothetical protein
MTSGPGWEQTAKLAMLAKLASSRRRQKFSANSL